MSTSAFPESTDTKLNGRDVRVQVANPSLDPMISVLVPIYGAESTLDKALRSVADQSYTDIEIICVNDASPDACADMLERFVASDDRFVVITHQNNAGYGASMNDALALTRGRWIAILEPDDYLRQGMYETMIDALDAAEVGEGSSSGGQIDVVKTPYIRNVSEGTGTNEESQLWNCSYYKRVKPVGRPFNLPSTESAMHLLRHHPSIWSAIYRKHFLQDEGITFGEYPGGGWADNEFFYKTLLKAHEILYVDEPFYVYQEESSSDLKVFRAKNPTLPFERWHSMQDVLDDTGASNNESIQRAHIATGFTYMANMEPSYDHADDETKALVERMFDRMDPKLVAKEDGISPNLKASYVAHRKEAGLNDGDVTCGSSQYYKAMIGEALYATRTNGISYTLQKIKGVLE